MRLSLKILAAAISVAAVILGGSFSQSRAQERSWRVEKSSGHVWVARPSAQKVSLTKDAELNPGDSIRTGSNGRVLLVRGEERIVISPNSEIGIPAVSQDGLPTTITQKAGSISLEVEKRNVQHFEVETPYLAAVVKGTQFRVSVDGRGAKVDVTRGQVQVSDFKTGQNVLVVPGQTAGVSAQGAGGLKLQGAGPFNPIQQGAPRSSSLRALVVPKGGLKRPDNGIASRIKAHGDTSNLGYASAASERRADRAKAGVHIGAPLGEVKLDFTKATHGLAHAVGVSNATHGGASSQQGRSGVAGSSDGGLGANASVGLSDALGNGNGNGNGSGNGNGNGSGNGNGNGNGVANGNNGGSAGSNGNGNGNGKALGKNKT